MAIDSRDAKPTKALQWVAVVPCAVAGGLAGFWAITLVFRLSAPMGSDSTRISALGSMFLPFFAQGYGAVLLGGAVAPYWRRGTAITLAVTILVLMAFAAGLYFASQTWVNWVNVAACAIGCVAAVAQSKEKTLISSA